MDSEVCFQGLGPQLASAFLAMVLGCFAGPAAATVTLDVRVVEGARAPGTSAGTLYRFPQAPVLNNAGQIAFKSLLSGPGINNGNNVGIWSDAAGSIGGPSLIVRRGIAAPGTDRQVFENLYDPVINNMGQVAFRSDLRAPTLNVSTRGSVWSEAAGSIGSPMLVASTGDAAPGLPDGVILDRFGFDRPLFGDFGRTAFRAFLEGPEIPSTFNNLSIWSAATDSLETLDLVAASGAHAPGYPATVTFGALDRPTLNSSGQVALLANLIGDGAPISGSSSYDSIWLDSSATGGDLHQRVAASDPAPGLTEGAVFHNLSSSRPVLDASGRVAFQGVARLPSGAFELVSGVWSESTGTSGELSLIAAQGGAAPGMPSGFVFDDLSRRHSHPLINGPGQTAFWAQVVDAATETYASGIWIADPNSSDAAELIVRSGQPVFLSAVEPKLFLYAPNQFTLNARGQIAFQASLFGDADQFDQSHGTGLWVTDTNGDIRLVARTGDQIDMNDDPDLEDLRIIERFEFIAGTGNEDGRPSAFNDLGELAFVAHFTDGGSAIIVAAIEPVTLGDFDGSGTVAQGDLDLVLSNWGQARGPWLGGGGFVTPEVSQEELDAVLINWGSSAAPSFDGFAVPEPAAMSLAAGLVALLRRQRRFTAGA